MRRGRADAQRNEKQCRPLSCKRFRNDEKAEIAAKGIKKEKEGIL